MHPHFPLSRKMDDELRVFGRDSSGRDSRRKAKSSMGKAVVSSADRPDQGRDGAEISGSFRPSSAITHSLAICCERQSSGGLFLVEDLVEEDDLPRNSVAPE